MCALDISLERLVVHDEGVLAARAARLATASGWLGLDDDVELSLYVRFHIGGQALALPLTEVARVARACGRILRVPRVEGEARLFSWLASGPIEIAETSALTRLRTSTIPLVERPVILLAGRQEGLALVVEGPLDLHEGRLVAVLGSALGDRSPVPIAGRLEDGCSLLDVAALAAHYRGEAAP